MNADGAEGGVGKKSEALTDGESFQAKMDGDKEDGDVTGKGQDAAKDEMRQDAATDEFKDDDDEMWSDEDDPDSRHPLDMSEFEIRGVIKSLEEANNNRKVIGDDDNESKDLKGVLNDKNESGNEKDERKVNVAENKDFQKLSDESIGKTIHENSPVQNENLSPGSVGKIQQRDDQPEYINPNSFIRKVSIVQKGKVPSSTKVETIQCEFCTGKFGRMRKYRIHVRTVHKGSAETSSYKVKKGNNKNGTVGCDACGVFCASKASLMVHLKVAHGGEGKTVCHRCGRDFLNWQSYRKHMRDQHGEEKDKLERPSVTCDVCGKSCSVNGFRLHMLSHTRETMYECPLCRGFEAHYRTALRRHAIKAHAVFVPKGEKVLPFLRKMKKVTDFQGGDKSSASRYECRKCGKGFDRADLFERHMEVPHVRQGGKLVPVRDDGPKFDCQECGKVLPTASRLAKHTKKCLTAGKLEGKVKEKKDRNQKIKCDVCKNSFCPSYIKYHKMLEHGTEEEKETVHKIWKARLEKRRASRRKSRGDKRAKDRNQQTKCDVCEKSYCISYIKAHKTLEHGTEEERDALRKFWKARLAKKRASVMKTRGDKPVQDRNQKIKCDLCDKSFSASYIKAHKMLEHGTEEEREIVRAMWKLRNEKQGASLRKSKSAAADKDLKDSNHHHDNGNGIDMESNTKIDGRKTPRSQCDLCGKTYSSAFLKDHKKYAHGTEEEKEAVRQMWKSRHKRRLNRHHDNGNDIELESNAKINGKKTPRSQCDLCGKTYSSAFLKDHKKYAHGTEEEKEAVRQMWKSRHKRRLNRLSGDAGESIVVKKNVKHSCQECGKSFPTAPRLARHAVTHTRVRKVRIRHKCEECDKEFNRPERLQKHIMSAHTVKEIKTENPYQERKPRVRSTNFCCKDCVKRFESASKLANHSRVHARERVKCELCHRGFHHQETLKLHRMLIHGSEEEVQQAVLMQQSQWRQNRENKDEDVKRPIGKTHYCKECDHWFSFPKSRDLAKHMASHTGVRLTCNICDKQYSRQYTLRLHKMAEHGTDEEREEARRQRGHVAKDCSVCGEKVNKKYMSIHMRGHTDPAANRCVLCGQALASRTSLRRHLLTKHSLRMPVGVGTGEFFRAVEDDTKGVLDETAFGDGDAVKEEQVDLD